MSRFKSSKTDQHGKLSLSRRTALMGGFFAGYALAALSADADPIHTDQVGLVTGAVMLPTGIPAYIARPAGKGRYPAVLLIHEAFGLHEYIRDVCLPDWPRPAMSRSRRRSSPASEIPPRSPM